MKMVMLDEITAKSNETYSMKLSLEGYPIKTVEVTITNEADTVGGVHLQLGPRVVSISPDLLFDREWGKYIFCHKHFVAAVLALHKARHPNLFPQE